MKDKLMVEIGEPIVVNQYQGQETDANLQTEHYCGLIRAGNGNLVALYNLHPDLPPTDIRLEQYLKAGTGYRITTDNGRTWSAQRELALGGNKGGTLADGTVLLPSGSWWVNEHELRMAIQRSANGGRTWHSDRDVRVKFPPERRLKSTGRGTADMHFWGNIIPLDKKTAVGTMYGPFADSKKGPCILIRSTDRGRSWQFVSVIAGDKATSHGGFFEPSIVRCRDGRLLCVMRTGYANPRILEQCWSSDAGQTWTDPIPSPGIPGVTDEERRWTAPDGSKKESGSANVSPMLTLLDNGVLAMVYGRPGLKVALSLDGTGQQWDKIVEIVPSPKVAPHSYGFGGTAMAGLEAIGNGQAVLVYDVYKYAENPSDPRLNTIFARVLTVKRSTD